MIADNDRGAVGPPATGLARTKRVLTSTDDAVLLAARATPGASRTKIAGERAGRLLVQVTAPPLQGRANDAVCRLLAKALGIGTSRVSIVGGERSRDKLVRIEGISAAEVAGRLGLVS